MVPDLEAVHGAGCNRRQLARSLLGLGLLTAGCMSTLPPRKAGRNDLPIPLGPRAQVQVALVSDQPTNFTISGVEAGTDLVLPRTSIARVLLPLLGVTIAAQVPCFRRLEHFVQAGGLSNGGQIAFSFSNLDRRPGCEIAAAGPPLDRPLGTDPRRLALVIGSGNYGSDWPSLAIVAQDRKAMAGTLRQAGYQVSLSFDRSRAGLLSDAASFGAALARADPLIAIVYVSGHGVSLGGKNYLVPTDAPPSRAIRSEHLVAIDDIVQILSPVQARGGCALLLVDACRAESAAQAQPFISQPPRGALVNYSTAPGGSSFDADRGMSAWTDQFVTVAGEFPDASIDQIIGYANRYTLWETEATERAQAPVLYGTAVGPLPAFGAGPPPRRAGVLPQLPAPGVSIASLQ
jgi:hypothetical protein